jgi:hypothetical protein
LNLESNKKLPQFLSPEGRKKTMRKRHFTRGVRAFLAIILAIFAGMYLVCCSTFQKNSNDKQNNSTNKQDSTKTKKSKTDKKEHRKGMPVRDNIVE